MHFIGSWVRRETPNRPHLNTLGHRVESEIEGAAITHCGRRMEQTRGEGELVTHNGAVSRANRPLDWDLCSRC